MTLNMSLGILKLFGVEAYVKMCVCKAKHDVHVHTFTRRTCRIRIFKDLAKGLELKPRNEEEAAGTRARESVELFGSLSLP